MAASPSATAGVRCSRVEPVAGIPARLREPLRIGSLTLDRRLFMAPMAGITSLPFRRSVRRWGAGLVLTEMISAYGVHYGNRRTLDYLACEPDEHPLGFQLFGADAGVLADAAARCVEAGADLVDLNMACPSARSSRPAPGRRFWATRSAPRRIVAAVVGAVEGRVPVTVKIRAGLREGDELGRRAAPRLVAAGAAAVCIHPRTASQLYRGRADHAVPFALAADLPVPVIASGDVDGRAAALALLDGGAAAVMLARHALGCPWLFAEILGDAPPPSREARLAEVRRFTGDVMRDMGARSVGYLRQFWPRYRHAGVLDKELARALMLATDAAAVRELLGM